MNYSDAHNDCLKTRAGMLPADCASLYKMGSHSKTYFDRHLLTKISQTEYFNSE